jgi:hypothetical protein
VAVCGFHLPGAVNFFETNFEIEDEKKLEFITPRNMLLAEFGSVNLLAVKHASEALQAADLSAIPKGSCLLELHVVRGIWPLRSNQCDSNRRS